MAVVLLSACAGQAVPGPPGTGTGTGTGDAPVAVRLVAEGSPRSGALLTVTAELHSRSGQAYVETASWGDGSPAYRAALAFSCPAMAAPGQALPSGPKAAPTSLTPPPASDSWERLQHIYRTPGRHTVTVTATHSGCGPNVPTGSGTGRTDVQVTGPIQPGNGPVQPQADIGLQGVVGGTLVGYVRGRDYDGHLLQTVLDYGDGSVQTDRNAAACQDPRSSWAGSSFRAPVRHRLPPGDYRLRLTVTSADCMGGTRQDTTITRLVRVTARAWKDLEPPRTATRPLPYTADCCLPYVD